MDRTYLRGDIYYADLEPGVGSEQNGYRPVVIIQNDVGNRHSPTVIVAAVSSRKNGVETQPTHFHIGPESCLGKSSVVLLEQIRTLDKHRLERYAGRLNEKQLSGLNRALAISVGLEEQYSPDTMVLSLCGVCAENYRNTGAYYLRRVNPEQTEKETCTYCGQRMGYDYVAIRKSKEA